MSAVGLTKAMRARLLLVAQGQNILQRDWEIVCAQNFAAMQCGFRMLTPRGHAALAAPRMTQAELEYLEFVEAGHWRASFSASGSRVRWQCIEKRWIRPFTSASDRLTPSGLKALNDVRAAMGDEEDLT